MSSKNIEFLFLKWSIEQFFGDLEKTSVVMQSNLLSENEKVELMSYLIAAKERIESLESKKFV
ncbi:MAG: hypothetical protein A2887_04795 [Alphaproteobacteria bacterium RIFCSPLOWO2_01_FULL_40_26]|nr:MAG: hypothetical protein A3D15_03920 [Alphaproteobacteria bacterium RIFCSPHIGHO2_02_FULL_40_34]OFW88422.1 MAG: hypothetical protein A2794_01940 [Alphaproteobacteria bacterium RIFCSPHIGHO2_01_FULL_40_8]OFW94377.1 MAG: hypothetical protein A2887_04795 [Alphaproteobacteria bacterium RIFCSPLOWO2_01_FULL_40_26]OFX09475.1 MAG: hypothetical protein A3H30_02160 [Alphaproteobacteria bacterium RIFCSPLOWO2_02_FULL_40_19]OFX10727.1 MAG: hypothetical protein A3G22_02385 [Alphaproteobacteria bacterium RI